MHAHAIDQRLRRITSSLLVLSTLLAIAPSDAQCGEVIDPQITSLLAADSAANRAWGAYLAGKDGERTATPRLLELLSELAEPANDEERFLERAVLDALVLLEASLDAEILLSHARRHTVMAVILASQSGAQGEPVLLDLLARDVSGLSWEAAANLLVASRTPGVAAPLLRRLQTELVFHVVDPGGLGGGGGDSFSTGIGCGSLVVPPRFPPVAIYELVDELKEGAVLLAPGVRPIYFVRQERLESTIGVGSRTRARERDEHARVCLAALAEIDREDLGLEPRVDVSVEYVDGASLLERVREERAAVLAAHERLVTRLEDDGLLLEGEQATLVPQVTCRAVDHREEHEPPLPPLPESARPR